jgi:hypothetical protein
MRKIALCIKTLLFTHKGKATWLSPGLEFFLHFFDEGLCSSKIPSSIRSQWMGCSLWAGKVFEAVGFYRAGSHL